MAAPSRRIRSTCSRRPDHDSVASSLSRMSTVARIQVRSACFRTPDHDSTTRGLEALTMTLSPIRSTPDFALDHDVGRPCVTGVEDEASRVRSPPSPAFDLDSVLLCGAAANERRSTGSACSPDHCSPTERPLFPGSTITDWPATGGRVNEKTGQLRAERDTGTSRFSVPVIHGFRPAHGLVQETRKRASALGLRDRVPRARVFCNQLLASAVGTSKSTSRAALSRPLELRVGVRRAPHALALRHLAHAIRNADRRSGTRTE